MQQHCRLGTEIHGTRLELYLGDITGHEVDAIVNAANARLAGGGGVDGAIHHAGGPSIMDECRQLRGCPVGQAVVTTAGNLSAQCVVHTVGPIWSGGDHQEDDLLRSAYEQSLRQAGEHLCRTIAFPSISTGAYGFPIRRASRIAVQTVIDYVEHSKDFDSIRFVLFSKDDLQVYDDTITELITRPHFGCWFDYVSSGPPSKIYRLMNLWSPENDLESLTQLRQLCHDPAWEPDTLRLLGERNWRGHLCAGLSIYLGGERPSSLVDALWSTVKNRSWVAPQLLCLLTQFDTDFSLNASNLMAQDSWESEELIDEAYVGKVANALIGLAHSGSWTPSEELLGRLTKLAAHDVDSADKICTDWLPKIQALPRLFE